MKELNDIISAYNRGISQGKQMALATVVNVEGSSYRRPGARMLVTEDGEITGAISGGCLEGDALRKAHSTMFQKKNKLEVYDTTDDEDNKFGVQLGCNGIVYILFEPLQIDDTNNPVALLKMILQQRKNAVLITLFNTDKSLLQKGTVAFINEERTLLEIDESKIITDDCNNVLNNKISLIKHYEQQGSALFQFIPPPVQLVVIGAGNDAQPLVEMASLLGWSVTVLDGRPAYATKERFLKALKIAVVKAADILTAVAVDAQTAFVLMTHNYNYDIAALEQLIATNCKYIGALGPKKKLLKMFDELHKNNVVINDQILESIYGPVGLDIGAETAEEIALSVISEIKAVFAQRQGASLRDKPTEIHKRILI